MNITAQDVKDLRDKTGAGMMDCKKALTECNGDMEAAIDYLREKGITKAAKKQDRIAAEGLSNIYVDGNKAVIVEVNSETDFVAKNAEFKELVDKIGTTILNNGTKEMDKALELDVDGTTIKDLIINCTAKIGEKISLRRFELIEKSDSEVFGSYIHMGGKISSLVVLKGTSTEVAKDVAMQAAAMRPLYTTVSSVPAEDVEHEKTVIKEQVLNEGKKLEFADKIIEGRINKFFEDSVLEEQSFVKDSSLKVKDYISNNNSALISLTKYEVGEGMEKRSDNFAEEVMNQIK
jgi:elongation factor Ts